MNYEYCAGVTYTIKNGDTLYEISRRHGVPLAMLLRANPYVDVFSLQAGDTICIPRKAKEELPYPMENPMQDSARETMEDSMENAMRRAAEKADGSAGMQAGRTSGVNSPAGMQGGMSEMNSSTGMQGREASEKNSSAGTNNADMNNTASQRVNNEQMDEMLVWSEQANMSRQKKGERPSQERKWCKYVVQPGDTLEDVLENMDENIDEFWKKNPPSRLYLLPGVAYSVCKR